MYEEILNIANRKFQRLSKMYQGFFNVVLDDWRGFRFVYDTVDVRRCQNDCQNCPLFRLLSEEREAFFSAGLYKASQKDKEIFGPQNFLNCKTLEEYRDCYVNFLLKEANTLQEIKAELVLIKNLKIIFTREGDGLAVGERFKASIIDKALRLASETKRNLIQDALSLN